MGAHTLHEGCAKRGDLAIGRDEKIGGLRFPQVTAFDEKGTTEACREFETGVTQLSNVTRGGAGAKKDANLVHVWCSERGEGEQLFAIERDGIRFKQRIATRSNHDGIDHECGTLLRYAQHSSRVCTTVSIIARENSMPVLIAAMGNAPNS